MEAESDKVKVVTPFLPTPITVVDNPAPTQVTVVDNSSPAPVVHMTNQPLPQKIVVKVNREKTNPKALQIAIGISDIDSIDVSITFDFSSLKIDSTTGAESNNPLLVPIGGGKVNPDGGAVGDGGRISSGGGGKTH